MSNNDICLVRILSFGQVLCCALSFWYNTRNKTSKTREYYNSFLFLKKGRISPSNSGPVHTRPKKFENAKITGHFEFVFEEKRSGKSRGFRDFIAFEKLNFQIAFLPYEKKAGVFKILPFEEHFRKLCYRDGLVCTVVRTVEIKLSFQSSPASSRKNRQLISLEQYSISGFHPLKSMANHNGQTIQQTNQNSIQVHAAGAERAKNCVSVPLFAHISDYMTNWRDFKLKTLYCSN